MLAQIWWDASEIKWCKWWTEESMKLRNLYGVGLLTRRDTLGIHTLFQIFFENISKYLKIDIAKFQILFYFAIWNRQNAKYLLFLFEILFQTILPTSGHEVSLFCSNTTSLGITVSDLYGICSITPKAPLTPCCRWLSRFCRRMPLFNGDFWGKISKSL